MAQKLNARRYASIAAGAEYIQSSERTLRRLIAAGKLTAYRLPNTAVNKDPRAGRLLRIDLNELDALMAPIPTVGGGAS